MSDRYFFDTSSFLAIIRDEPFGEHVANLLDALRDRQKVTSVLVAYELYRGISPKGQKAAAQRKALDVLLSGFSVKPLTNSQAMDGARLYRYTKGFADALIGSQCLEGDFWMVTDNTIDFERMPGIKVYTF